MVVNKLLETTTPSPHGNGTDDTARDRCSSWRGQAGYKARRSIGVGVALLGYAGDPCSGAGKDQRHDEQPRAREDVPIDWIR